MHKWKLLGCFIVLAVCCQALASSPKSTGKAEKTIVFPPIPEGYYAFGVSCQKAIHQGQADDPPEHLVRFDRRVFQETGGGPSIHKIVDLGNRTYRIEGRSYGNGDDEKGTPDNFNITVFSSTTFGIENNTAQLYTHCPLETVPKSIREDWFEF